MGINGTRALTCKYNAQLSCGRVQDPTLAMIAQREEEIKEFVPKEYYGLTLTAGNIRWTGRFQKWQLSFFSTGKTCKAGKGSCKYIPSGGVCREKGEKNNGARSV